MNSERLSLPHFLIVGAYSRNAGKTTFSRDVINSFDGKLIAVKITIIKGETRGCPRGGEGCGVCTSLDRDYLINEEKNRSGEKDTSKLLQAGAEKVLWLRVRENAVHQGLEALLKLLPTNEPVICESNSIVQYINPGLFLLLKARGEEKKKKSALSVENRADLIIETDPRRADFDFDRISHNRTGWSLA